MLKNFCQKSVLNLFLFLNLTAYGEEPYTLVKIDVPEGKYNDVLVMAIVNNNLYMAECIQTSTPTTWVFTGPPATYSIRITTFTDEGFKVTTDSKTIGTPNPPNPPNPDGPFDGLAARINNEVSKFQNFPAKELAKSYNDIAARFEGSKQPIIPTFATLNTAILDAQKIFNQNNEADWTKIRALVNPYWKDSDRTTIVEIMKEVAKGLDPDIRDQKLKITAVPGNHQIRNGRLLEYRCPGNGQKCHWVDLGKVIEFTSEYYIVE